MPDLSTTTDQLSVIIPARNEALCIGATLERLRSPFVTEVLVVDGQSLDETASIAQQHGATVLRCEPNRGRQLNVGANAATGSILLFLHADTSLPPSFASDIQMALQRPGVSGGAFGLSINARGWGYRLIEHGVAFRSRWLQLPYGDQAIFVRADVFRRAGGFPDTPVMEDYEFVKRLRKLGRMAIARTHVKTSGRRWIQNGLWRTTLRNQACLLGRWLGVSPERIVRWRTRNRSDRTAENSKSNPR